MFETHLTRTHGFIQLCLSQPSRRDFFSHFRHYFEIQSSYCFCKNFINLIVQIIFHLFPKKKKKKNSWNAFNVVFHHHLNLHLVEIYRKLPSVVLTLIVVSQKSVSPGATASPAQSSPRQKQAGRTLHVPFVQNDAKGIFLNPVLFLPANWHDICCSK